MRGDATTPEVHGGWGMVMGLRKWHYFRASDGRALCGKGLWLGPIANLEQGQDDSPDNCAECKRKCKQRSTSSWK